MSKSPWVKIGAWAADAERAEAEEREAAALKPPSSFPTLEEANATATKQKKEFKMLSTHSGSASSRGLTHEEMLCLPTGPRERSGNDMQPGRSGRGFSGYDTRPGSVGSMQDRGRDYEGRRLYGFQDEDRRGPSRVSEMDQPSRADEVDNWASTKTQMVPEYNSGQVRPGGKYRSLGGGGGPGASSRADEVDNWASVKKTISQPPSQNRTSSFGSGFSRRELDRWTRNEQRLVSDYPKNEVDVVVKVNKANPFGTARPREEVLAEKGLDWKKLDLEIEGKKLQHSVSGGSRPASSQSSRPDSPLSSKSELTVGENVMKQKPKVNPFGNAKPREVLLEEKGLDWKKIDLDLENRRVGRPETEEEKNLREEIERLKTELEQQSGDSQTSTHKLILQKEQEMGTLERQLDDKVRYSQKNLERQVSGAGFQDRPPSRPVAYEEPRRGYLDRPRSRPGTGSLERPPSRGVGAYEDPGGYDESRPRSRDRPRSRQGVYEEPVRGVGFTQRPSFSSGGYEGDYNERPRLRGAVDSWSRPGDNRGASQGGGRRGFFGSKDTDRSGSRW